ncbi:MAG: glycosyltransferase [Methanomassiliicoccus sp.]|nr:glycosyltransferase [Methanomassiliicoccus sp.]
MGSVTILSTIRNIEKTATPFIRSIINQTYSDYEILLIDACSTDNTLSLLDEELSNCSIPYKIIELESNQPQALNYPISNSLIESDYVALIDGDCIANPDWLSSLVKTIKKTGSDAVGGPGFTPTNASFLQKIIGVDLDARFKLTSEGVVNRHPNMNLLVKREVLEKIPFDETMDVAYDTDFGYRATSIGFQIYFTNKPVVYHHHRSTLKSYCKQQIKSAEFAFHLYLKGKASKKGDNVNPWWMLYQLPIFLLTTISLMLSFHPILFIVPLMCLAVLTSLFLFGALESYKITKKKLAFLLPALFIARNLLWVVGLRQALIKNIHSKIKGDAPPPKRRAREQL